MLEKHRPLNLNTPGTFVYEDIFKSPLKGRNPCEVGTWKISWGQGLVTVVRTFLHVRTLWWIQNCYINMFPSPHICLQLSVCRTRDCLQDGPHMYAKTNVCVSSCLLAVCFSVGLEITLWTHTPIMMMSSLHVRLRLMMQRHFCLCLYYPQCTWKMIKSIW